MIVDLETTVLSKLKCEVDKEYIPYTRAFRALEKHQTPLYCSDRCMRTEQKRRVRATKREAA